MLKVLNVRVLQTKEAHPPCLSTPNWYAATVQVYGQDKVLVLRDVDLESTSTPLSATDLRGDVTCLTYDQTDSNSFEYVARIFLVSV